MEMSSLSAYVEIRLASSMSQHSGGATGELTGERERATHLRWVMPQKVASLNVSGLCFSVLTPSSSVSHNKQKPKNFCTATTALTGVMIKQFLSGVVYDAYLVPSQLKAVVAAKAQTQAYNEAV